MVNLNKRQRNGGTNMVMKLQMLQYSPHQKSFQGDCLVLYRAQAILLALARKRYMSKPRPNLESSNLNLDNIKLSNSRRYKQRNPSQLTPQRPKSQPQFKQKHRPQKLNCNKSQHNKQQFDRHVITILLSFAQQQLINIKYMKISIILIIFVLFLFKTFQSEECPASHFDYIGKYALGKQDEVNKTITKIMQKISVLPNVTYNTSENTSYTMFNVKPVTFYYRDTEQKANVLGNDTIVIFGGRLQATLNFEWKKQGISKNNGSGSAFGLSDSVIFVKSVVMAVNGSFFSYELLDYTPIKWQGIGESFQITRIDPPNILQQDKKVLTQMINKIVGENAVRDELQTEIEKYYSYYLKNSLHDQHIPLDGQFDYIWAPGGDKPNVTIPFTRRGISVHLDSEGVRLSYQVQGVNYPQWKCGNRQVPTSPLNPDVFGESQQFISYDFYENALRYAIYWGDLDSDLTKQNWQSRMFQFFAGDLYDVVDKVMDKFYAFQPVTGNCKASLSSIKVTKAGEDTMSVSLHYDCEINIKRDKIMSFAVDLQLEVEGLPLSSTLDFKLRSHNETVTLYPYNDYKILQPDLGKAMVRHSVSRLYEGRLFGSGWPLSPPRDYPHFAAKDGFSFVYDSSNVNPRTLQEQQL